MKTIITTFALLCLSLIGFTQNDKFNKLDSFFNVLEENDRFFGSVAAFRGGEQLYSKEIGYADLALEIPNNSDTKFRIGSISKTFTATLIMKAVELGKVNLDEPIENYFPKFQRGDEITVRYLLNHRSGITNFTNRSFFSWYTEPINQTALLDTIARNGFDFAPNTDYSYSNSNYVLLTFILEQVFEDSYASLLRKHIVNPLDLKNTAYGGPTDPSKNEARSYQMKSDWELEPEGHMSIPLGAGGIVSTPRDLCIFIKGLFDGKLISVESVNQMKPVGEASYGFALYGTPFHEMNGWGHGGNIDAFASNLVYFEEEDISIAVSSNASNYETHDVGIAVISELFGKPYDIPSFDFVTLSSEELDKYLGTYETPELPMDFTIFKNIDTLFLTATGQSPTALNSEGNDEFSIIELGVNVKFMPSEKMLKFEQRGMAFDFTLKAEEDIEVSAQSESIVTRDLDQYVGTYTSDALPIDLTISKKENHLIGQGEGQPSFILSNDGGHLFSNKEIGLMITFEPEVGKMKFEQGGASFEMIAKK